MTEEKVFASGGFHKPADRTPSEAKQAPLPGDRFQSVQSVGRGRWSEVYQAIDITTNEMVAVKLETVESKKRGMADHEFSAYNCIHGKSSMYGFPRLLSKEAASDGSGRQYLIMERLGQPLSRFAPMPTLAHLYNVASQMIDRLLALHDEGIVHRDLNADNFLLGHHEDHSRDTLFLVDFGLAAPYMHPETGEHIPESIKTYFTGTVRFASCNQLKLLAHSRRDDMEAIAYILVWMFAGRLPWNGLRDKNMSERDYRALVLKMKLEFKAFVEHQLHKEWSPQQIMSYLGLSQQPPSELKVLFQFLEGVYGLAFWERPAYSRWSGWFKHAVARLVHRERQDAALGEDVDMFVDNVLV